MSLKYSRTTADFLAWDEMTALVGKLQRDNRFIAALLIAVGSFTGLRISDILPLCWSDFLGKTRLCVLEQKTGKYREIKINGTLLGVLDRIYRASPQPLQQPLLYNPQMGKPFTVQHLNRMLKRIKYTYRLSVRHFSTHSLRKTFGRRIWQSSGYSEKAITVLSVLFNHSSFSITRRYLGIKAEEIEQVYDLL